MNSCVDFCEVLGIGRLRSRYELIKFGNITVRFRAPNVCQ